MCDDKPDLRPDARPDARPDDRHSDGRGGVVAVQLQPGHSVFELPRAKAKNVARLLEALGLRQGTAIVARDGVLLTPDVPLYPGQTLLVRKVMSSG